METRRNGSGTAWRPYCILTTSMGFLPRPHHVYGVLTAMSGRIFRESSSCPRPYDVLKASLRRSWRFYGVPTTTMAFLPNLHCVPSAFLTRPWFSWAIIYKTRCFSLSSSVYLSTSRLYHVYVVLIIIMAEDMKNLLVLEQMLIVQQQQASRSCNGITLRNS